MPANSYRRLQEGLRNAEIHPIGCRSRPCATDFAFAADDDDDKVPAAEVTKVEDTLSTLGCNGL